MRNETCAMSSARGVRRIWRCIATLCLAITVVSPLQVFAQNNTLRVNKAFEPATVPAGSPAQMTVTLFNTDTAGPQTSVSMTDHLPAGTSWSSVVSNTCGGSVSAPGASLALSGATVPAATASGASTCAITVQVLATAPGTYTNTIASGGATGTVNGGPTANANPASSSLTVTASTERVITGSKAFAPSTMARGETGSFTIRINNPNTFAISGVAFTDNLAGGANVTSTPAGGSLVPTAITANTCGGSAGITGSAVSLSGGAIPAGGFCVVTVSFTATQAATYNNTLPVGAITVGSHPALANTANIGGNLAVQENAVTMGKSFNVAEARYPNPFTLTLDFRNNTQSPISNLAVSDDFPDSNGNGAPDLVVSEIAPQVMENTCGGVVTANPLATGVSLTGGTLAPSATCRIRIRVRANQDIAGAFSHINTTGSCSGRIDGGNAFTCSPASDDVTLRGSGGEALVVGIAKGYLSNNVPSGQVVRGRIRLMTPEATDIVAYTLPDTFYPTTAQGNVSDVVLAPTGGNFTFQNCGASPAATPLAGGNGFTLSSLTINGHSGSYDGDPGGWPNAHCVVEFDVVGAVPGTHDNIIPIDQGRGRRATDPAGTVRGAINRRVGAGFTYLSPLSAAKSFSPHVVTHGGLSRLTIRLSNSNDRGSITNLTFTDNLPSPAANVNVRIAPAPNLTNTCGGTVTAEPGGAIVALVGGAVLPGAAGGVAGLCEVSVDVIASDGVDGHHDLLNRLAAGTVTGTISGQPVSNNANADATIHVRAVGLQVLKGFSPSTIDGGETSELTITIQNPNTANWLVNGIRVVDNMPAGMEVADPANASTTCTVNALPGGAPATINAVPGAGSFTLQNAALYGSVGTPPSGGMHTCSVTLRVRALISDNLVNTIAVGDVTSNNGAINTNAYSATLVVLPKTAVGKRFVPNTIPVGGISELEIEVLNASSDSVTNIRITDVMPTDVTVADPLVFTALDACPGLNVNATPGSNTIAATGLNLGANQRCRFRVQVTSLVPGVHTNLILPGQVSSDQGGIRTEDATDDLTVVNGPEVEKSFADDTFVAGETTQLTMRVRNPAGGGAPLTNVVFVDNLPTGMAIADPVNLLTAGACATGTVTATAGADRVTWNGGTLAGGETCDITVDVTATTVGTYRNVLPACDVTATPPVAGASAAATASDAGTTTCNVAGAEDTVEVIAQPELSFVKALAAESITTDGIAQAGEELTYTITLTNASTTDATAVPVIDLVPAHTTFVSADNGGVLNGAQVEWSVDVPGESERVLSVVFRVADPIPAGVASIANNATVDGEGCATDPCVETPTETAALAVSKAVTAENGPTDGVAEPGEQLTYTITIENMSGVDAEDVAIIDVVPEHTTFVSASDGGVLNGAQVEWTTDIPARTSMTRTVVFQVVDPIPAGVATIANNVTANDAACETDPCVETPVATPAVSLAKALIGESGSVAGVAESGERLTYALTLTNDSDANAVDVAVVDFVPAHTVFVSADNGGVLNGAQVDWTLDVPARGSVVVNVVFQVVDPIPAGVMSIANNATADGEGCANDPCVETPTELAELRVSKAVTAEDGSTEGIAERGERITYTITVENIAGADAADVAIVDLVPEHTSFVSASDGGVLNGAQVEWLADIPARGSVTRTVVFQVADPIPAGVGTIANNVTANGIGCATDPCVETPIVDPAGPILTLEKTLDAEDGATPGVAEPGERLTYALTIRNPSGLNAVAVSLVDTVPAHTTFVSADNGGVLNAGQVQWTLDVPAQGEITVRAVFLVDDPLPDDVTAIVNNATVDGEGCATQPCVETPVGRAELSFRKLLSAEGGVYPGVVEPGERLTYTITVANTGTAAGTDVAVVDLLDPNVTFVSADNGGVLAGGNVEWTLARIEPRTEVVLTVVVQAPDPFPAGLTRIVNSATVDGEGCATEPCVETPVVLPPTAIDDDGGQHQAGTAVTVVVPANDQPGTAPLDVTTVWIVGTAGPNQPLVVSGEGTWSVNPATGEITFTPDAGFSNDPTPIHYTIADTLGLRSNEAEVRLEYIQDFLLRLTKQASVRTVRVGDLVQYTLTLENIGEIDVVDATVQDVPPNGFTFVPGSLRVNDGDNHGTLVSVSPLRITDIDVARGDTATLTYLMAVGAGTLPGAHTNTAVVLSNEVPISNEASATVTSAADPLLDESLILGTVFHDRDGDGWQDSAKATGIVVTGGIDETVYVAGSTTVDAGNGPQPQADASAPLNHGIRLGRLDGRNSPAMAEDARRIVISRRLREARFSDGFTLVTDEGTTLTMDAAGNTRVERSGDMAKGLSAQDIRVQRNVVALEDGGVRADYVITNAGIDERGIPGVRIGTVEGLLVETDGHGRFHLEGITPSHFARGSNVIMKVDAATLPRGATFTTENPRVKRATPGVMTRFDFGVQMPEDLIEGGTKSLEMALGEVVFEANSAEIRGQYAPVIAHMATQVEQHGGGQVDITGFGGNAELALVRAKAVHDALVVRLPAAVKPQVQVSVRGEVDGPEVLRYGHRISIGEVFFDTDKSVVKPAFASVIAKIAAEVDAGRVSELLITGHADKRASDAYNLALGQRRAEAVLAAIRTRLSPERARTLRVTHLPPSDSDTPYLPVRGQ